MKPYNLINTNPPIVLIENVYTEEEQYKILNELKFLFPKMLGNEKGNTAVTNGKILAEKVSIWLDDVYVDRNTSDILTVNRKTYEILGLIDHWFFVDDTVPLRDSSLVSYYEEHDYYKAHSDRCYITAISWINKSPKNFTGGDVYFPELELEVKYQNNTMLIFPGWIKHSVSKIRIIDKDIDMGGRFAISQFIGIVS